MTLAYDARTWMPVSKPEPPRPISPFAVLTLHHSRTVTVSKAEVVAADLEIPQGLLELVLEVLEIGG